MAPHLNEVQAKQVKGCALRDEFWLNVVFNQSRQTSRAAKGPSECSFYPREVLHRYLCTLGHVGFERLLNLTHCAPEEHWHPTWLLNHVDWSGWRAATVRALLRNKTMDDNTTVAVGHPLGFPPEFAALAQLSTSQLRNATAVNLTAFKSAPLERHLAHVTECAALIARHRPHTTEQTEAALFGCYLRKEQVPAKTQSRTEDGLFCIKLSRTPL